MPIRRFSALLALLFLASPSLLRAQEMAACAAPAGLLRTDVTGARADLMRALAVLGPNGSGAGFARRAVQASLHCADSVGFLSRWATAVPQGGPGVYPLPVSLQERSNSAYPRDRNDGAMWTGVGVNVQAEAGVLAEWGPLSAAALPRMIHQPNEAFDFPRSTLARRSEFAHPYVGNRYQIDLPKRMGPDPFSNATIGNSYVQLSGGAVYAALSNENLWFGPTQVHSLLMSNTAPGMAHLRVGTQRPIDLKVVHLEFLLLYGDGRESEYFDGVGNNDSRLYQATMLSIEPTFLPGLHLGLVRVQNDTAQARGQGLAYYLSRIIETPFWDADGAGTDPSDRQGGLYARWVLPESGFEAYLEWAREDFPFSFVNLLYEPDYSQVWAAGFQKIYASDAHLTRVWGEFLHLGQGAPVRGGRDIVRFYATRSHGYTHRGQMLGAAAGPGSDAQTFGIDRFDGNGRTGLMFERVRYDDDTYYQRFSRRYSESLHDVEVTGELRRLHLVGPFEIEGAVRLSHRWNRDFIPALDDSGTLTENNWGTELSVRWWPGS